MNENITKTNNDFKVEGQGDDVGEALEWVEGQIYAFDVMLAASEADDENGIKHLVMLEGIRTALTQSTAKDAAIRDMGNLAEEIVKDNLSNLHLYTRESYIRKAEQALEDHADVIKGVG